MNTSVALFDLDGVIFDTEKYYTILWDEFGKKYLGRENFGITIKGQTLVKIFNDYFPSMQDRKEIDSKLFDFERNMPYEYIPGAEEFIDSLKEKGVKSAVVTSSSKLKMNNVYRKHPDFKKKFDSILISDDFTHSKPSPECYLTGMKLLNGTPENTVVFEDSVNGLISGRDSGARLVGLSTTNPIEVVKQYTSVVIPDFIGRTIEDF